MAKIITPTFLNWGLLDFEELTLRTGLTEGRRPSLEMRSCSRASDVIVHVPTGGGDTHLCVSKVSLVCIVGDTDLCNVCQRFIWDSFCLQLCSFHATKIVRHHAVFPPPQALSLSDHRYNIYIYLCPCAAPTCAVLLQAAHTFCVSVLYVHVVFDDKHVLNLMC